MSEQAKRAEEALETRIEELAAYAHEAWSGWMKYQEKKGGQAFWDSLPMALTERWVRQANTDYADLPEDEKKSDRVEARRMITIMLGTVAAFGEAEYRRGVEALRDLAIQDWSAGKVYSRQTVNAWLRGLTARLLSKEGS